MENIANFSNETKTTPRKTNKKVPGEKMCLFERILHNFSIIYIKIIMQVYFMNELLLNKLLLKVVVVF